MFRNKIIELLKPKLTHIFDYPILQKYKTPIVLAIKVPDVSIIMRTKNRELLLERAILDVNKQTLRNFELIIINDGGDKKALLRLLNKLKNSLNINPLRIKVIHNKVSLGMEHASNQGLKIAKGKYICIHDDDDTWDSTFLETTTKFLDNNRKYAACAVRTEIVYEEIQNCNNYQQIIEKERKIAWEEIHQFSLTHLLKSNIAVPISCCYRRKVVNKLKGFQENLPVTGDWEFHLRLASKYDVAFLDSKPLAFWHQRVQEKGSLGNSVFAKNDEHKYFDLLVRDTYLKKYTKRHGFGALLAIVYMMKHQQL